MVGGRCVRIVEISEGKRYASVPGCWERFREVREWVVEGCEVRNLTRSDARRFGQKLRSRWVSFAECGMARRAEEVMEECETSRLWRRGRLGRRVVQKSSSGEEGDEKWFLMVREVIELEILLGVIVGSVQDSRSRISKNGSLQRRISNTSASTRLARVLLM